MAGSATACTTTPPPPTYCGFVGFAPNSDWGAFNIWATNIDCNTARGLASGSKYSPARYSGFGWTCVAGRWDYSGLPELPYRCTAAGNRLVTFQFS